jgi:hypothetical protein
VRATRHKNRDAYRGTDKVRAWRHESAVRTMGLTGIEYEAMLAVQEGVCALCGQPPKTKRLAIDHDHRCCPGHFSCGKCIRGLLCTKCNLFLGLIESPFVEKARVYLEQFQEAARA